MDHYTKEEKPVTEAGIMLSARAQTTEGSEMTELLVPDGQESKLFASLTLALDDVTTMRVKSGSKVRNLLGFALAKIKEESVRHIIFTGSGPAISKTITCVEIVKRNLRTLHQVSKIFFRREAEYWNPNEEELDRLKVTKHIPAIAVLLSKESLDVNEHGYQAPGSLSGRWSDGSGDRKASQARKRTKSGGLTKTKRTVKSPSASVTSSPSSSTAVPKTASGDRGGRRKQRPAQKERRPKTDSPQSRAELRSNNGQGGQTDQQKMSGPE